MAKNGKKVGYRGRTGYTRRKAPSVATCRERHVRTYATSSSRLWETVRRALSSTRGVSRPRSTSQAS